MNARRPSSGSTRKAQVWLHGAVVALVASACVLGNTRFDSPPRYDGAGYAVLADSLRTGQGYREIDHPERPPHAHYPPGYPSALAALWLLTGPSVRVAHAFSAICTVIAVLASWLWIRAIFRPSVALMLALAVAVNWMWGRVGGSIQSESLFLALAQMTLLALGWASRDATPGRAVALGALLGCAVLTRHVGVALGLAIVMELVARKQIQFALATALSAAVLIMPWAVWLALVRHNTQLALLAQPGWPERLGGNALFYLRRVPDALTGPFVEVATVFRGSAWLSVAATVAAALATSLLAWGTARSMYSSRRRLAGLVLICGLALLWIWPFTEAGRFLIPLVPPLLIVGCEALGRVLGRVGVRDPRKWAATVLLAAAIPYSAYALVTRRASAQERAQAGFDAACSWIAQHADRTGPILARQPGEVFWLTHRQALAPPGTDSAIESAISCYRVAYLLVDEDRFANAAGSPLKKFVQNHPERVELAWPTSPGALGPGPRFAVYAVGHGRPVPSQPLKPG